jgi:hypothetical protein
MHITLPIGSIDVLTGTAYGQIVTEASQIFGEIARFCPHSAKLFGVLCGALFASVARKRRQHNADRKKLFRGVIEFFPREFTLKSR